MADDDVLPLPPRLLDQPAYVLSLLGRAARAGSVEAVAAARGFRLGHVAVLAALEDFGPSSQRALGARLRQDPSDVLRLLDDLEAGSHVRRGPDPDDRRRHRVSITAKGRRALGAAEDAIVARQDALLAALSERERTQLGRLARKALAANDPRAR
jgi:DNA-binding MarR family transcriptional regulator